MKTITEFPATLLRQALVFWKQQQATASPDAPPAPAEGELPEGSTPPSAPATPPEAAALGAALGVEGQRLERLIEALAVVGDRIDAVSRVRVFGGEEPPQGGRKQGDFYYVVDLMPRPQDAGRRGHAGRDRGGAGRGGAGRGGPDRGDRGGREREPPRNEVPAGGAGWTLERAPGDPRDKRGGRRGPSGPGGDRRGPGGRGPGRGGPGGGGRAPGR